MQESTVPPVGESWLDRHRGVGWFVRSRATRIASAVVLVAVAIAVTLVVLAGPRDTALPPTPEPAPPTSAPLAGPEPGFGMPIADRYGRVIAVPLDPQGRLLPQHPPAERPDYRDGVAVTDPEGVMWQKIGALVVPFSTSDGPTGWDGMFPIGYAHTPQGAAVAGWNILGHASRSAADLTAAYAQGLYVADPGRGAALSDTWHAAGYGDWRLPAFDGFFPSAFQIVSYRADFAVIRYAVPTPTLGAPTGTWLSVLVPLVWDGDWRVREQGDGMPAPEITSLAGWTTW